MTPSSFDRRSAVGLTTRAYLTWSAPNVTRTSDLLVPLPACLMSPTHLKKAKYPVPRAWQFAVQAWRL